MGIGGRRPARKHPTPREGLHVPSGEKTGIVHRVTAATRHSYDLVAPRYVAEIGGELASKPLDRAVLNAFAEMVTGPVLDVGAGPGHIAAYLRQQGVTVASTDLSPTMCQLAAQAGGAAVAADMTQLPFSSDAVGGIVCLYAVIHLDVDQRAAAYASFRRVLQPGGAALVAFHTRDDDHATGDEATVSTWWDQPVTLTFRYLDPAAESHALVTAGFDLVARLDRTSGPDEHASERTYLLLR